MITSSITTFITQFSFHYLTLYHLSSDSIDSDMPTIHIVSRTSLIPSYTIHILYESSIPISLIIITFYSLLLFIQDQPLVHLVIDEMCFVLKIIRLIKIV